MKQHKETCLNSIAIQLILCTRTQHQVNYLVSYCRWLLATRGDLLGDISACGGDVACFVCDVSISSYILISILSKTLAANEVIGISTKE